jgi:hypothetical protein
LLGFNAWFEIPLIDISIYYDKARDYSGLSLAKILSELTNLTSDEIRTKEIEKSEITNEEQVVEAIRQIKPQARGSVVASGGSALPISGSKKLNLQNTPVIIVKERSKPVYVFPCKVGEKYYSVDNGLSFLKQNLPNLIELEGLMEDSLVNLISDAPYRLEDGLILEDLELNTPTGETDIVMRDSNGKYLVVEVEREASDSSVGQILRLSAGFEKHRNLDLGAVRAGVVCFRINPNVLAACTRANIEVWKYDLKSKEFSKVRS